jgi:glucan phosphoethanolaminetransferase (alkaline phosphatase superfamily)
VNAPGKPCFTEDEAKSLARYIHAAAVILMFCLPVMFACGIGDFFRTSRNILLKGQGVQVMLILISVFFIRFYVSIAVVFVLWRRRLSKEFRPIKHPLGETTLEKIEYIPEEDKIKYGRLISFVFLPKFLAAITLGWFLMARNHCP